MDQSLTEQDIYYAKLAIKIFMQKYRYPREDWQDMFQEACVAILIVKQNGRFDQSKGSWKSYVVRSIFNHLINYYILYGGTMRSTMRPKRSKKGPVIVNFLGDIMFGYAFKKFAANTFGDHVKAWEIECSKEFQSWQEDEAHIHLITQVLDNLSPEDRALYDHINIKGERQDNFPGLTRMKFRRRYEKMIRRLINNLKLLIPE